MSMRAVTVIFGSENTCSVSVACTSWSCDALGAKCQFRGNGSRSKRNKCDVMLRKRVTSVDR